MLVDAVPFAPRRGGASLALVVSLLALAGCHSHHDDPAPTYTVGGTVMGLTGSLTLSNNGAESRTLTTSGAFTFNAAIAAGAPYAVTITAQPANQTCTVASGSGTMGSSNVSSVAVTCVATTYSVGGTVSGLAGAGLVLRNNGGDDLARSADGAFTFTTRIATGGAYAVAVAAQPTNQSCTLANATGNVASANVTNVAVTCETVKITMDIGPTGGTLTGPDGVQIVVPPGALSAQTTIGIERNGGAWPTPLPQDFVPAGGNIYEFTPHDITFDKPVLFRIPLPAGVTDPVAFVASLGLGWMGQPAVINGNFIEWERPVLSWGYVALACAGSPSPYFCTWSRGFAAVTADPPEAITLLSPSSALSGAPNSAVGSAGTWAVNTTTLTTMHLTMNYTVPGDCGSGTVDLKRIQPGQTSRTQSVAQSSAPFSPVSVMYSEGSTTLDVPAQEFATPGTTSYVYQFDCSARGGGADFITFVKSPNGSPGFTVGGQVSGLTVSGLVLKNAGREELPVPANATSYAFRTPQADATFFSVNIKQQPTGAICSVQNRSGTIASTNVVNASLACTPTTPPPAGPLIFTANSNANNITIVRRASTGGSLSALANVAVGSTPSAVVTTSDGRFVYVANQVGSTVNSFSVNKTAGTLSLIPLSSPGTFNPFALAVDPQDRFLFVANGNGHTVSSFTIDPGTGALTAAPGSPFASSGVVSAVAAHPTGNFVYVANQVTNTAQTFSVNVSTGALTLVDTLANAGSGVESIAVTPNGKFAYEAAGNSVARFTVNQGSGALASTGFTVSNDAFSVAVHPNGNFLYVANGGTFNNSAISQFAIDSGTGALTPVGSPLVLPKAPRKLAIDATGTFLYATIFTDNSVASFSIDGSTGSLTNIGSAATGSQPMGVAVTP